MGTCCCGNKPSERFIGTWTDHQYIQLTIEPNGYIDYQKQVRKEREREIMIGSLIDCRHHIRTQFTLVLLVSKTMDFSFVVVAVVFVEHLTIKMIQN